MNLLRDRRRRHNITSQSSSNKVTRVIHLANAARVVRDVVLFQTCVVFADEYDAGSPIVPKSGERARHLDVDSKVEESASKLLVGVFFGCGSDRFRTTGQQARLAAHGVFERARSSLCSTLWPLPKRGSKSAGILGTGLFASPESEIRTVVRCWRAAIA